MTQGRHRQLVDEGISRALEQAFQDLLSAVETRTITDAVGVTTGSFFHHFPNRARFAEAVARRFEERWQARIEQLGARSSPVVDEPTVEQMRHAAASEWAAVGEALDVLGLKQLLWVARDQPLGEGSTLTGADVLRDANRALLDAVTPVYAGAIAGMGREMMPPFDIRDFVLLFSTIVEGLHMAAAVDPDAVRPDLYVDVVAAAVLVITRPRIERADHDAVPELAALEARLVSSPPTEPSPSTERVETWRQIADRAAHLFVDRSPNQVRVADVAAAAGVSPSTVYHQFGSVSAVAAAGWARHMPELRAIAEAPLTPQEGPLLRIEQALTRYVELLQANRGMAEALVFEVVAESGPTGGQGRRRRLRDIAPLFTVITGLIRELRVRGALRRRVDAERVARSLLQLATMQTLQFTGEPVERIVDETMGMVFEGVLVPAGDA